MIAVTPRIRSMLAILLPSTLPVAKPELPSALAMTLMMSSGKEVPIETMVSPIIKSEIPRREAMAVAPFTSQSAPLIRRMKPSSNSK